METKPFGHRAVRRNETGQTIIISSKSYILLDKNVDLVHIIF
ncbi:MAG: hypothetical protein QG657_5575 [Acidobacteriota bacterium]|nr:hypothetical protein [Acidobacteriota bacterium]